MITLFGPGVLYGIPPAGGGQPANFGKIIQMDLEIAPAVKPIHGGSLFPIDFGRGKIKATAKAKMAALSSLTLAALFFGVTPGTGQTLTQYLEAGSVPSGVGPYTYVVANPTGFTGPYEVIYAATGLPLTLVTAAPAAGQFSVAVSTGTLTFAAADAGKAILMSYGYTAATGSNLTINNALQGDLPIFSAAFYNRKNGKPVTITLPTVACEKLGLGFKEDAALEPELDMLIGANAAGQVMVQNFSELS